MRPVRRPVPLAVWLVGLAAASQTLAAWWALATGQPRAGVMAGSAVVFVAATVLLYVKRPAPTDD